MPIQRWYIRRVRLNSQGYDSSGYYYGSGAALWYATSADGEYDFYLRGPRDYIKAAYNWVRNHSDPISACRYLNSTGRIGT